MKYDLNIKNVVNAYYLRNNNWKREISRPRIYDAVVFFTDGEIEYFFEDKRLTVKAGELLFLPGNLAYSGKMRSKTVAYYVINFNCLSNTEYANLGTPCAVKTADFDRMKCDFQNSVDVWNAQSPKANFIIKSLLFNAISQIELSEDNSRLDKRVEQIIAYVNENFYKKEMTVKSLCEKFYISESQIRRNIIKATGLTPNEYISFVRLNKAKSQLSYTDKPIIEIAEDCGFSSPYYFSRWFNKNLNMSPSEFRKLTSL